MRYDGEIEVHHPAIQPTRHAEFYRFQARNRVWLARRNLPAPVGVLYVLAWAGVGGRRSSSSRPSAAIGVARDARRRHESAHRAMTPPTRRWTRPMSWSTIWRMTRAGHPPIILMMVEHGSTPRCDRAT